MPPRYLHRRPDWPILTWDERALAAQLGRVCGLRGSLVGRVQSLGFDLRQQVGLETLTTEVVRPARSRVRSSSRRGCAPWMMLAGQGLREFVQKDGVA